MGLAALPPLAVQCECVAWALKICGVPDALGARKYDPWQDLVLPLASGGSNRPQMAGAERFLVSYMTLAHRSCKRRL